MRDTPEELWTIKEAARYLRVHPETVRVLLRDGNLKGHKIGRRWRLKPSDVETFLLKEKT